MTTTNLTFHSCVGVLICDSWKKKSRHSSFYVSAIKGEQRETEKSHVIRSALAILTFTRPKVLGPAALKGTRKAGMGQYVIYCVGGTESRESASHMHPVKVGTIFLCCAAARTYYRSE